MSSEEGKYVRRLLLSVGVVLAVGALVTIIWVSIEVWLAVFAGILLAVFFRTLALWVSKLTHLPRSLALVAALLGLLALGVLGGWLLAPRLDEQLRELSLRLPAAMEQIHQKLQEWGWSRYVFQNFPSATELSQSAGKIVENVTTVFRHSIKAFTILFVIIFLGIYLAASPQMYLNGFIRMFPVSRRRRVGEILDQLADTLGHWLLGQMLSMAVVGTLIGTGLSLLGIPLGLALGVLAGLLNFMPIVGSLLSAAPAVLLGFLISPLHALYVVLLYLLVNGGIESHVLVPLIQRFAVKLPPALAVLAIFLLTELFGFMGLLLAVPLAATFLVLIKTIYLQDVLGEDVSKEK